jgi:hypothetical protein
MSLLAAHDIYSCKQAHRQNVSAGDDEYGASAERGRRGELTATRRQTCDVQEGIQSSRACPGVTTSRSSQDRRLPGGRQGPATAMDHAGKMRVWSTPHIPPSKLGEEGRGLRSGSVSIDLCVMPVQPAMVLGTLGTMPPLSAVSDAPITMPTRLLLR